MSILNNFFKTVNKKQAISWALYDFANSAYVVLIISFVFPIYFKENVAGGNLGDLWWGIAVSLSILIGGLVSPIVGAIADYDKRRKTKFIIFALLSIIGTAALFFVRPGMLFFGLILFILTNLFFEIAQSLYDSFLPDISTKETTGRISGLGWGIGYLGGIAAMLLYKPLYQAGFVPGFEQLYMLTFPLTALFFFLFALPSFIFIKEKSPQKTTCSLIEITKIGFKKTFQTLKEVRKHKRIAWFLIAFYLLNDALVTIFAFLPIYAKATLNFSYPEIILMILIAQLIGVFSTLFFGWLSDTIGSKRILLTTIFLWAIFIIGVSLATTKTFFYVMIVIGGLIMGSSQTVARSWFSKIIPEDKKCEFFGFNGFASKIAATSGPLIFGTISAITLNQRIAMIALLPFFIISFIIFYTIEEE